MGVDWTALEEALRVAALRHAADVITGHPQHDFYAIALYGVSTAESENIAMPVLALNSLQALARDRALDSRDQLVERGEDLDEDDAESSWEQDEDDQEDDQPDAPEDDLDAVLSELEQELEEDSESFYSDKWEPSEWHWSSIELCEDPAAQIWSDAMTSLAAREGWEPTIKRYYRTMVNVARAVREQLNSATSADLVVYVADEEHAERLLRLCLSEKQLAEHFPQLEALAEEH